MRLHRCRGSGRGSTGATLYNQCPGVTLYRCAPRIRAVARNLSWEVGCGRLEEAALKELPFPRYQIALVQDESEMILQPPYLFAFRACA
jgi:hypothetical protein